MWHRIDVLSLDIYVRAGWQTEKKAKKNNEFEHACDVVFLRHATTKKGKNG